MSEVSLMSQRAALETLLREVRERHGEFAARQAVSSDVIELMKTAGVYRALVARRFGGEEKSPAEFLRLIELISIADGSSGWVASFGFSAVYLSALPVETLAQIYARTPDVVFAGGIYPPQHAPSVAGGMRVSGRWPWGSGCTGAEIIGVGIKTDAASGGGLPRIAVMPREQVRIEANWDVNGLKGTGSHDIVVEDVVVPLEWTFVRGGGSSLDTPLFRYPTMALAAQVLAVVGLGVARAALDEIARIASDRPSITGAPALADRAYVQTEIAKSEAALRSARAFFFEATDEAFAALEAGERELDRKHVNALRLASTHAARTGADVARAAYTISGTTGIFSASPIARFMHDAIVVPQHAFLADGTWQNAGRVLLGLDTPPGFP
jgi:alkylation response protein AidB-like acyl-CoA dehydrogenase